MTSALPVDDMDGRRREADQEETDRARESAEQRAENVCIWIKESREHSS